MNDNDLLATPEAGPAAMRGGAMRVGGYVAGGLLSAVSASLLLRHLGPIVFGMYITAQSLVAIVDGLSDLGLTAVGVRELSLRTGAARVVFARNLLGLRIAVTVVGIFVMVLFGLAVGYSTRVVEGVVVAGGGLLLQCGQASLAISLMSALRLGWITAIELMRQAILTTLIIALVFAGAGMLPFLAVTIPAAGAALLVTARLVHGDVSLRPSFDRLEWRAILAVILPFSAAVAAAVLYFRMSVIIVSVFATAFELGNFGAAFRVTEALIAIPGLAASVAFPIFARAARDDRERLGYAVGRVFTVNVLIGAWAAICMVIGAHLAIRILAGPKYPQAGQILAIQGVAIGATFVTALWGQVQLGLGAMRTIMLFNAGVLAAGLIGVTALVLADGPVGAAIATSTIEVVAAVVGGVLVTRADRRLRPPVAILPRVAVATALAACALLLPVGTIGRLVVATLLYTLAVFAFGLVPDEVRQELGALWSRIRLRTGS